MNKIDININEKYKDIIVLYHGGCMDGFAGAYIAWTMFADKAEYIGCKDRIELPEYVVNHNNKSNTEVYLIDFSFPLEKLLYLQDNFKRFVMIDHHITEEENIRKLKEYRFDLNKSGCYLAFEYFYPNKEIPLIIKYISDNDLWKKEMKDWEYIIPYIYTFDMIENNDFIQFDRILNEVEDKDGFEKIKDISMILNRITEKNIKHFVNNAILVEFEGYNIYAVNAMSGLRSEIGNRLAEKTGTFAIIYYYDDIGKFWKASLRSVKDFDVSVIAKKHGGGGHKNAASFILKTGHPLPFVKVIEEK